LDKLFHTELRIADIAVEYGFDHAQSYIRAFRHEFGLTPGEVRKTGQFIKVMPPIQLFPSNQLANGVFLGPEIVYVPKFYCVGKRYVIPNGDGIELPAKTAREFWMSDKDNIPNIKNPDVYLGLTRYPEKTSEYTYYIPSVSVTDLTDVPGGFEGNIIPSCLCARFHYVGEHHYMDINADVASEMYNAIMSFNNDKEAEYGLFKYGIFFEKIDVSDYDGTYCKMEWFSPVYEKNDKKSSSQESGTCYYNGNLYQYENEGYENAQ